ncbi:hypothetical protein ACVUOP_002524, partial [Klebsiella oxytoca]
RSHFFNKEVISSFCGSYADTTGESFRTTPLPLLVFLARRLRYHAAHESMKRNAQFHGNQ